MDDLGSLNPWGNLQGVLRYELHLPWQTPSNNTIRELHHFAYKKLRQTWCEAVLAGIGLRKPAAPIERAFLVVIRECEGGGLDWDNVYGGLKPVLDCLVSPSARNPSGLGLIRDDSPRHMPFPPFVIQKSSKRGLGKTTLLIYELPDTATA